MSPFGTKPPVWDVLATVAAGGNPDMTRAVQFSRELPLADMPTSVWRGCATAGRKIAATRRER
jgi:hypothetical protein